MDLHSKKLNLKLNHSLHWSSRMNPSAFSLVELLVGISVVAIIGLIIMATLQQVQMSGGKIDSRAQMAQSFQLLQRVLMNESACTAAIDKTAPVVLNFAAPQKFDVSFDLPGFGKIKANEENKVLNLYIDEVYVDGPIFSEILTGGLKSFVGILKIKSAQRIVRDGLGSRGVEFKLSTVGAITVSFTDAKDIVNCQMSPRGL